MSALPPEQVDAAVEQACRELKLDLTYAASVHAYLAEDEDDWPACCGSDCEPCVLVLAQVARRALILIEQAERKTR